MKKTLESSLNFKILRESTKSFSRKDLSPAPGGTASTVLYLDKQIQQLQKENEELNQKLEKSYMQNHTLENQLEE